MGFADISNAGLRLGLSLALHNQSENCMKNNDHGDQSHKKTEEDPLKWSDSNKAYPSLTLGPPHEANQLKLATKTESPDLQPLASSPSAVSSFSNSSSINRERDFVGEEFELEVEKFPSRVGDVDEDGSPCRKKLRLTKDQSAVLEDSFRENPTLNPKQKQELARKLNLRARQVEVWFQNRRARTKLKQTEVECELLKKCCETLTEENKKLQREVQELKAMKTTAGPFYMQLPAATLTICPSCERICSGSNGSPATTAFLLGSKSHHFSKSDNDNYPFSHSPAAC